MSNPAFVRLVFSDGFTDRDAEDARERGYRSHVWAELEDGSCFRLTFFEPVRLGQELALDCDQGRPFFVEPGLIVVPEVTMENMEAAARALAAEGFFMRYLAKSSPE